MIDIISNDKALEILETNEPKGEFISGKEGAYTAIYNIVEELLQKEFDTISECVIWFKKLRAGMSV